MSISFEKVADRVFAILKGSGRTVTMFDNEGSQVYDPIRARRFFAEPESLMVSLVDDGDNSALRLYLSKGTAIDGVQRLIQNLRMTASHYNLSWITRKFSRRLSPKDFAYQAERERELAQEGTEMTQPVIEGMTGSTRSSYQTIGNARVIVRHRGPIDDSVIGARGRNIKDIFVENTDGERFRMPAPHLTGARAMARHLSSGGEFHDTLGCRIQGLVREWRNLKGVGGYIRENARVIADMAEARLYSSFAANRMAEISETLRQLSGSRGYPKAVESLNEATVEADDAEIDGEVSRMIDVLGVEDGNEPFMEGLKSLARCSLKHRTAGTAVPVEEADELPEDDGLAAPLAALTGDPATLEFDPERVGEVGDHFETTLAEIAGKLAALVPALEDPALADYLSGIQAKLESTPKTLTPEEKQHMARALAVAGKADPRLKIGSLAKEAEVTEAEVPECSADPTVGEVLGSEVHEAAEVVPVSLDAELFASLTEWSDRFSPDRLLVEFAEPSDFAPTGGDAAPEDDDRFDAGQTVTLIPTPEVNRKSLPEANWLKKETVATLKAPVLKGTLDLVEVELEDGSTRRVYGVNVGEPTDDTEMMEGVAPATAGLSEAEVADAELGDDADLIADAVGGEVDAAGEGSRALVIADVADLLAAEQAVRNAGLPFEIDVDSNHLTFDTAHDAELAAEILDREGIPHEPMGEGLEDAEGDLEDDADTDGLDADGLDTDGLGESLDEDAANILGGDQTDDLLADVSRQARPEIDDEGNVPTIHSEDHVLDMGDAANARRAMQVLDDAGIDYTAYGSGRFEFASAEDQERAVVELDAAGLTPETVATASDNVSFMSEMRRRIIDLMI